MDSWVWVGVVIAFWQACAIPFIVTHARYSAYPSDWFHWEPKTRRQAIFRDGFDILCFGPAHILATLVFGMVELLSFGRK